MSGGLSSSHTFLAPAKLNLDLRITGRRENGYHDLETIFCLIGLYDVIDLSVREDGRIILHTPTEGVLPDQDLVCRAAKALQQKTGASLGADIRLKKSIPMGGGLGGGSSDAATILLALNQLWACGLNRQELMDIGVSLGADVPFFIFGRNAFARGIGEQLSEMSVPEQWYVVVKPTAHVSTAVVFSHKSLTRDSEPSIMPTFQSLKPFRNDMQAVVLEEYPEVDRAYQMLSQFGLPLMTGSGACLFLALPNEQEARRIHEQISAEYQAYCVPGLRQHPLFDGQL